MEFREASLNAMKADIQAMPAMARPKRPPRRKLRRRATVMEEKDMKACMARLHGAMEAIDQ